jgi:hypothetical protein
MRCFDAHVRGGRLVLDIPTDIPERTVVQLVLIDDVIDKIRMFSDGADRIALHLELEASIADTEAGRTLDLNDVVAALHAKRVSKHSSIGKAQEDDDKKLVIYQSTNREGSTFSLSPKTRKALQARFGDKLHISPRIFIAHGGYGVQAARYVLERLHGGLAKQLIALLTGFDDDLLARADDFEFRDPATDEQV